jgi:hypothetical protein
MATFFRPVLATQTIATHDYPVRHKGVIGNYKLQRRVDMGSLLPETDLLHYLRVFLARRA